jgi:hypothetical protein
VEECEALGDQLSVALEDTRVLDSAQLQSLVTEALANLEPTASTPPSSIKSQPLP